MHKIGAIFNFRRRYSLDDSEWESSLEREWKVTLTYWLGCQSALPVEFHSEKFREQVSVVGNKYSRHILHHVGVIRDPIRGEVAGTSTRLSGQRAAGERKRRSTRIMHYVCRQWRRIIRTLNAPMYVTRDRFVAIFVALLTSRAR